MDAVASAIKTLLIEGVLSKGKKAFRSSEAGTESGLNAREEDELNRALERTRERMRPVWQDNQILGRKGAIGCVSLEISQRCNLDCSLCYLSPLSNDVIDLPIAELYRRLEGIREHYGVGTNVQISGGDPTLRQRDELVAIVRYARTLGLNPALFTNGIKCSRSLLEELSANGLSDVAFHVDLTQKRPGYATEKALNAVRREYLDRARGLPLMVIFNTTVHQSNFHEIPDLVRFFIGHADVVGFASFQLQADTGRGTLRKRDAIISQETVREQVDRGAQSPLPWDTVLIGHPQCHNYVGTLAVNGKAHGILNDAKLFADFLQDFAHVRHDRRQQPVQIGWQYFREALRQPRWIGRALKYFAGWAWSIRSDLWRARGKAHKLSFFIQNFMDAKHLDQERIDACSFMVMTHEGPVSMCAFNAERDKYIGQTIRVPGMEEPFDPLKIKTQGGVAT